MYLTAALVLIGTSLVLALPSNEDYKFKDEYERILGSNEEYKAMTSEAQKRAEEYYATLPKDIMDDANLNVPELIRKYGYPVETHYAHTVDGYVLCLHRIPHGKNSNVPNKKVIFLQHGLLESSADWVVTGTNKGLAYIMADKGYDVWMGNFRGNFYSRNHTYLNPDEEDDFWKYSWHEMGEYDLPAMIDYVLDKTRQKSLFYAGHSQGTTAFFVMCSMKPEYNAKIKAMFSLAPIAFMNHMTSPLMKLIAFFKGGFQTLFRIIGLNEFMPKDGFMAKLGNSLCKDGDITQVLCTNALFAICGFSYDQMNTTLLPILMSHTPAGSSVNQFIHYAQGIVSGHFRQWDYGFFGNLKRYGRISPPAYDLKKIVAPVYLLYSKNDWLAGETDVIKLYNSLGNCQGKFLITDSKWNHLDYMFGIDAPRMAYSKIISLAARH